MTREMRAFGLVELRADEAPKLVGYAARFNSEADIAGVFRERVAPGAFAAAVARDDVRALVDHDPSRILGRTRAGTLRLAEDDQGLRVEIDPPETQLARDLLASVRRGDVNQMSFGFVAQREEWDTAGEPPLRTLLEVELFDVSVVTFPAYPDTSIAVRCLEAAGFGRRSQAARRARLRLAADLRARIARAGCRLDTHKGG